MTNDEALELARLRDREQHRDLLAMVAMHALIANRGLEVIQDAADDAYAVADAMLMAREK